MLSRRRILSAACAPWAAAAPQASVSMVEVTGEARKYWTRWRGPTGQGLALDTGYPDTWSDDGQNILWKAELPGSGNSSPILWRDRIFLTTAYDLGARRSILALDRASGRLLWETPAPDASAERANRKNGHASATPATDGERLYAYFGNHGLVCVDLNGRLLWHHSFGAVDAYHGTACSPLLYRDRVILFQDQRGATGGFIAALDSKTGKEIWKTSRAERVGWGTPVAIRAGRRDEIIVSGQHRIYAYDPYSGSELWRCEGNLVEVIPTPVAGHGLLFCSSGRAGPTLAIRPGGSGDITATHVAWQTPKGSPFVPSPLLYQDYLYLVNDMTSIATCYHAPSGKLAWQGRLGEARRESFSASPVAADGRIFITNDSGETFVLAAGPEFRLERVNTLNARTLASPALAGGRFYFRTATHLVCIGQQKS